jgi:predicted AAA+ superfamily ATPase
MWVLQRIATALEEMVPKPKPPADIKNSDAYVWNAEEKNLIPVEYPESMDIKLLQGIDEARDTLLANTIQFSKGFPANNVLLWGARGMGKSSLIKEKPINQQNQEVWCWSKYTGILPRFPADKHCAAGLYAVK